MPIFLLIRHGENDYVKTGRMAGRLPGVHLNARGQAQAEALGEALKNVPLAAIYASPLERAQESAAPIARARGLEIQTRPALLDTHVGDWEGLELKKLFKLPEWKLVQSQPSRFTFPNGESFFDLQYRLVQEIETIARSHQPREVVAVVFHADPIKLVVTHYLGLALDSFQRLACDTGSVTALALRDGGVNLLFLNRHPPFELEIPGKK
ncbi:MAG: histidine phosphatase family protein [Anaerolineales bacterium]